MAASSAPMGSLTIASHFRNEEARRSSRVLRSSGSTTVGPVTTVIAPNSSAAPQPMPAQSRAASAARTKLIGSATMVRRSTPSPAARSSRTSSANPPSKTTMATARPTIGCSAGPKATEGSKTRRPGPTIRPTANRRTMAGSLRRQAIHCAPTPATAMQRTAIATECDMGILG